MILLRSHCSLLLLLAAISITALAHSSRSSRSSRSSPSSASRHHQHHNLNNLNRACVHASPRQLKKADQHALCAGAEDAVPGECARLALKAQSGRHALSQGDAVRLCRGATSTWPALCARGLPRGVISPGDAVPLCRSAASEDTAACVAAVARLPARPGKTVEGSRIAAICGGGPSPAAAAECVEAMPGEGSGGRFVRQLAAVDLCAGASSVQPALCFARAEKVLTKVLPDESLRRELCRGAASVEGPIECVSGADRRLAKSDGDLLVSVCRGADDSAPADCLAAVMRHDTKIRGDLELRRAVVELCAGVHDGSAAECFKAMPRSVPAAARAPLCTGFRPPQLLPNDGGAGGSGSGDGGHGHGHRHHTTGSSSTPPGPAACFLKAVRRGSGSKAAQDRNMDVYISLCRGATSDAPAQCVLEMPHRMPPRIKYALCTGSSNPPGVAKCAAAALRQHGRDALEEEELVKLCNGATSAGPVDCFTKSPSSMARWARLRLCASAVDHSPGTCATTISGKVRMLARNIENLLLQLCTGSASNAPALCYADMPAQFSIENMVRVCRGAPPSDPTRPAECVRRVRGRPHSFRENEKVRLCQHGGLPASAACINGLPAKIDINNEQALVLCRGVAGEGTGPVVCLEALSEVSGGDGKQREGVTVVEK